MGGTQKNKKKAPGRPTFVEDDVDVDVGIDAAQQEENA